MQIIDDYRHLPPLSGAVGFVPTMGALHAGHLALIERARAENDALVASIFVNPLQFGVNEDLSTYPRPLERDTALLREAGVDVLYAPTAEVMYPKGFKTTIHVAGLGEHWCGAARPGHFDGVCTVVAKLLHQVRPARAYFGEKDYQQLCIIRRMVRDLDLPVEIVAVPTVREADGLALSSRNAYLSAEERAIAPALYTELCACAEHIRHEKSVNETIEVAKKALMKKGFAHIDYLALCQKDTLQPLNYPEPGCRLLVAAKLGRARLLDNVEVYYRETGARTKRI